MFGFHCRGSVKRALTLLVLAHAPMLGACDLSVTLPGETPADALEDPSVAPLLAVSAQGAFECAYTQYTLLSGLVVGEYMGSQTFLGQVPYQRRDVRPLDASFATGDCGSPTSLHTPVAQARFVADDAFDRISGFAAADVPNQTSLLALTALYAAYSYTVFGEGWCSSAFDLGPEVQPAAVLQLAKDRFTTAIDLASQAGDDDVEDAAYVGRARVEMSMGQTVEALADAQAVSPGFEYFVTRSSAADVRENNVYDRNQVELAVSVDPAFWNLMWSGAPDPRVEVTDEGFLGQDGLTPMWFQQKYTSRSSPIRLASYTEARLIEAEVQGGATAVTIINELLVAAGLLGNFASVDPQVIQDEVQEQRRRELFLEGHRMGVLQRLGTITNFTSGSHPFVGDTYGGMACFPLPDTERNGNPNIPS